MVCVDSRLCLEAGRFVVDIWEWMMAAKVLGGSRFDKVLADSM